MEISEHKREQISTLIAEGENLDPLDLETFYQWAFASHEALDFLPLQQRRFDEYCTSSFDSSMRIYVGVWLLRLALWAASSDRADFRNA